MDETLADGSSVLESLDFNTLLLPIGIERFFCDHWEKRPAIFSLQGGDFSKILAAVGPLEVERLASLAREGSQAWLSNEYIAHSVIPVDTANARQYLDIGANLYFLNVPLLGLTDKIADALGVPRNRVIASIFLTPDGYGAAQHFDKNENFTIQLTGRKSWTIGSWPVISNPHKSYVYGQPLPATLQRIGMDLECTPPTIEFTLTPGTMLYVPRGVTHSTDAKELSWSLNISYTGLTWAEFLTASLREHLLTRPGWRRSVVGVGPQSGQAAKEQNIMPALVGDLKDMLSNTEISNILSEYLRAQNGGLQD